MADGGMLAFGLRHVYKVLKGSDAVPYQSIRALGFEPVLYVYYYDDYTNQGAMVDELMVFGDSYSYYDETILDLVQEEDGTPVREDGELMKDSLDVFKDPELVQWATPLTTFNSQDAALATYGNEPTLNWAYGDICMIVRIGKAGDRLAFPTVAQVKNAYRKLRDERHYGY